jgi:NAD(P)-dependent dehydrogenase (short-subunit alcohol dehydrogenase family)
MLQLNLEDKVAIITGGSEGLGRAAAQKLAEEGARVAICARRKDVLENAAAAIKAKTGREVLAVPTDVTRPDDIKKLVDTVVARWGGVDIVLNNAGISAASGLLDVDDAAWQFDIDLKLMAAVRLCRLVVPIMKQRGGGRIINVTNLGGKSPAAKGLPTSVTRAAGINLTKSMSKEYAGDRILVNTICIGLVKSAQWERRAKGGDVESYYRGVAPRVPIGRVGEAHEFADLVAFLASDRAAFITGTAINFDGGASAVV